MKTPIECWNCDTEYDYDKHEVCPVCECHWLDAKYKDQPPPSGSRVSVVVDHKKNKLRTIPALLVGLLLLSSCTKYTCPTYANVYPIPVVVDHYDTAVSVSGDTTIIPVPYKPYKGERIVAKSMLFLIGSITVFALITHDEE